MPNLPTYESKKNIQPGNMNRPGVTPVTAVSNTAPIKGMPEAYEGVNSILQGSAEIIDKWQKAQDTMDYTKAKASYETGIAKIKADVDNPNTSPDDFPIYQQKLQDLKKDFKANFHNKELASRAEIELDSDLSIASLQIGGEFKKKQLFGNEIALISLAETSAVNIANAATPMLAQQEIQKLTAIIQANVSNGTITPEKGLRLINDAKKLSVKYNIYNDVSTHEDQSQVLADLRAGDNGPYAYLSPNERLELIEDSQKRIFQNNQSYKRNISDSQNIRTDGIIDKFANGTITFRDIDAEMAIPEDQGGIPRKTLLQYQKALQTGVKNDLNRLLTEKNPDKQPTQRAKMVKQYNDMIDNLIDDKTDQWKAKEMLAKAFADGIINAQEQRTLSTLKSNLKDIEFNRSTSPMVNAVKGIKQFFKMQSNSTDDELAFNIKQLLNGITSDKSPDIIMKQILNEQMRKRLSDHPTYPKEGKIKVDRNGNKVRIFPDGTYLEEKE